MKTWTVIALWIAYVLLAATTVLSVWAMGEAVSSIEDQVVALEHLPLVPPSSVDVPQHVDVSHADHGHETAEPVAHEHDHSHVVVHVHPHDDEHGDPIPKDISAAQIPDGGSTDSPLTSTIGTTLLTTTVPMTTTTVPGETTQTPQSTVPVTVAPDTTTSTTTLPAPDTHAHVVDHSHDHDHTIIVVVPDPEILIGGRGVPDTVPPTTFVGSTPP